MIRQETARASFWSSHDNLVTCSLCHHGCRIPEGRTGTCGVRENSAGKLTLPFYGAISSMAIDPIEKKPLYHYYPGSQIFSVGFLGCNLRCPFCQNYSISQSTARNTTYIDPTQLVDRVIAEKCNAIAYTYNEPSIHHEYVCDAADLARKSSIRNVLVTNGQLCAEPASELLNRMDAVNIDLKSFSANFYRKELGGSLDTVKEFIRIAVSRCHVELTTLLIPGKNDSDEELSSIASFIAGHGADIPLHISAYYPTYKYDVRATTAGDVDRAAGIARKSLSYVYPGNIAGPANTYCPECENLLVERHGYLVGTPGLSAGSCKSCGAATPIVLD